MDAMPEHAARLMAEWGGLQPYRQGDAEGQCLALLSDLRVEELPWETAPRTPPEGEETQVLCVKRSRTRCVLTFEVPGPEGAGVKVYAKRNLPRGVWKRFASRFRSSKARREWDVSWRAVRHYVPAALPLLYAERRAGAVVTAGYLLTLGIPRSASFADLFRALDGPQERAQWMAHLGRFVRLLHDHGFAHDDLSVEHVLVASGADPMRQAPTFHLIDLDQSRVLDEVSAYRRAHNFFQIFRSLPEDLFDEQHRMAFYRAYSAGAWSEEHVAAFERAIQWIRRLKRWRAMLLKPFRGGRGKKTRRRD